MKKVLYLAFTFLCIFSIPLVSYAKLRVPEEVYIKPQYGDVRGDVKEIIEKIGEDRFNSAISDIVSYYNSNYSETYPYYYISVYRGGGSVYEGSEPGLTIRLFFHQEKLTGSWSGFYPSGSSSLSYVKPNTNRGQFIYYFFHMRSSDLDYRLDKFDYFGLYERGYNFNFCTGEYLYGSDSNCFGAVNSSLGGSNYIYNYMLEVPFMMVSLDGDKDNLIDNFNSSETFDYSLNGVYLPYMYYYSNYDFIVPAPKNGYKFNGTDLGIKTSYFELIDVSGKHRVISSDDRFTLDTYINSVAPSEDVFPPNYAEINLNNYAYVALSLKDYNVKEFNTTVYVKGQYCLTPVYNYGTTERKDVLPGTQIDRCSPYYDNFTPVRTYLLDSDLKNHSIYYLKSHDKSRENIVRVDTSIFDITYITEENKNNPEVCIDGKCYSTIPFDDLTDTSNKSEDEGYNSGSSEKFDFSDVFSSPLDFLKDLWSAIVSVFDIITAFIALLPPALQSILFASFSLAIVLGIIKILL